MTWLLSASRQSQVVTHTCVSFSGQIPCYHSPLVSVSWTYEKLSSQKAIQPLFHEALWKLLSLGIPFTVLATRVANVDEQLWIVSTGDASSTPRVEVQFQSPEVAYPPKPDAKK